MPQQTGNQIFSGTALTGNQYICVGLHKFVDRVFYLQHSRRLTDQFRQCVVLLHGFHLLSQTSYLLTGMAQSNARREGSQQLLRFPRLGDEIGSANLNDLDRFLYIRIGRHEDHDRLRIDLQDLSQILKTLLPAHGIPMEIHIQQDHVRLERPHEILDACRLCRYLHLLHVRLQQ